MYYLAVAETGHLYSIPEQRASRVRRTEASLTESPQTPAAEGNRASRKIGADALSNLIGAGVPAVVALFVVRPLISAIGPERFGVLTLGWALVGYFTVADLGLARALTNFVSESIGAGKQAEISRTVPTALVLMALLGGVGGLILGVGSNWAIRAALKIPGEIRAEARGAFLLCVACVPIVTVSAGLRGVLEGHRRFLCANAVKLITGVGSFLGPLLALRWSHALPALMGTVVLCRLITCVAYAIYVQRITGPFWILPIKLDVIPRLLAFGGWLTASNLISPLMVYGDRFLVGGLVSLAAVTYYGTAFEVGNRLLSIPSALSVALFPTFALISAARARPHEVQRLYNHSIRALFAVLCPITLVTGALGYELFTFWLGPAFALAVQTVVAILAIGVLSNGLATVPFALIQANGRPDLTARLHFLEVLPFLALSYFCICRWGITGAAIAWTARVGIDAVVLFWLASGWARPDFAKDRLVSLGAILFATTMCLVFIGSALAVRLTATGIGLVTNALILWKMYTRATWRPPHRSTIAQPGLP
jgi:O-antigen/teichoic acid export membrane protein